MDFNKLRLLKGVLNAVIIELVVVVIIYAFI